MRREDAHHLARVLRLRDGERVVASDGAGCWVPCRWASGALVVDGQVVAVPASSPPVAVGFVPTKGDRPEWVVQHLTELGIDRVVVVSSARSVVRWDGERGGRHLAKLREVARQAGMQSRRVRLPFIEGVVPFGSLATEPGWSMAVPGGPGPALPTSASVLIGPEGGWDPAEESCGLPSVGLGPAILRAETAALAAATLMVGLRSGLVAPGA